MLTIDFKRLRIQPGDRILDIGCGSGRHACEAIKFKAVFVLGADAAAAEVQKARQNLVLIENMGQCRGKWAIMAADICNLPFEDAFFDLIICSEILEHVPDHRRAARELARVLKPGQNLVVTVPRTWPERICWMLSDSYHRAENGHIRIYTRKALVRLLRNAGFMPLGGHFAHSLHVPYWWLKCVVGPSRDDVKLVKWYHKFLVWDMMKQPRTTRLLDHLLNPLMGKSMVMYLQKDSG